MNNKKKIPASKARRGRRSTKKPVLEVAPEHEQLVRDIKKGQSMQMLSYLYKMKPYKIIRIARQYGLTVYDPSDMSIRDMEFCRGSVGGLQHDMYRAMRIITNAYSSSIDFD